MSITLDLLRNEVASKLITMAEPAERQRDAVSSRIQSVFGRAKQGAAVGFDYSARFTGWTVGLPFILLSKIPVIGRLFELPMAILVLVGGGLGALIGAIIGAIYGLVAGSPPC